MAQPDAYLAALEMLARRELSEAELRSRLARGQFSNPEIESAVARLSHERALDDRRTALARARAEVTVHRRGRSRVLARSRRSASPPRRRVRRSTKCSRMSTK